MDLFGKRSRMTLLIVSSSILLVIIITQFVKGGGTQVQQGFIPVNEQMQALLDQNAGTPSPVTSSPEKKEAVVKSATADEGAVVKKQPVVETNNKGITVSPAPHPGLINPSESTSATLTLTTENTADTRNNAAEKKTSDEGKTELNTASLEQLDALPGIGASKAKAILAYRVEVGGFKKLDDLLQVKGIGEKILEKLKPHLYIASP